MKGSRISPSSQRERKRPVMYLKWEQKIQDTRVDDVYHLGHTTMIDNQKISILDTDNLITNNSELRKSLKYLNPMKMVSM